LPSSRWARGGRPSASAHAQAGWWCFDTTTPVVAGSYRAARAAVDVAVTARSLSDGGRVAILDVDVHHGNGTQDLFWRDPNVLYVSLHGDPDHEYPYFSGFDDESGEGPGRGLTRNLPLARGTDDHTYLDAIGVAGEVIDEFDPATVVVSLGFDASRHDPIGSLSLTTDGFRQIGQRLADLRRPTVLLQEGATRWII
jgi:acetoin utilization deacetylase AcuC-like enzyme